MKMMWIQIHSHTHEETGYGTLASIFNLINLPFYSFLSEIYIYLSILDRN